MGDQSTAGTEQNGLIYIYWAACKSCGYTTALHGRAACPDCESTRNLVFQAFYLPNSVP